MKEKVSYYTIIFQYLKHFISLIAISKPSTKAFAKLGKTEKRGNNFPYYPFFYIYINKNLIINIKIIVW